LSRGAEQLPLSITSSLREVSLAEKEYEHKKKKKEEKKMIEEAVQKKWQENAAGKVAIRR